MEQQIHFVIEVAIGVPAVVLVASIIKIFRNM